MRSAPQRLKPHAFAIRVNIDPLHWFLSPPRDTRSSLCRLLYHSFRGAKWTDVKKPERRQYLKNAYRVLLTRARQGIGSSCRRGRGTTGRGVPSSTRESTTT
jgi:hypothetical protein